jgi:hypothetical protein
MRLHFHQSRKNPTHVRDGKADPAQIASGRHSGDGTWISRGVEQQATPFVALDPNSLPRALPVEENASHAGQTPREPTCITSRVRCNHDRALARHATHRSLEQIGVLLIGRPKAQVDQPNVVTNSPINRSSEDSRIRREGLFEYLDGVDCGVGRLFLDCGSDRRTMTNPIDKIVLAPFDEQAHASCHSLDMRVCSVYPTIYHRDGNTPAAPMHEARVHVEVNDDTAHRST